MRPGENAALHHAVREHAELHRMRLRRIVARVQLIDSDKRQNNSAHCESAAFARFDVDSRTGALLDEAVFGRARAIDLNPAIAAADDAARSAGRNARVDARHDLAARKRSQRTAREAERLKRREIDLSGRERAAGVAGSVDPEGRGTRP